MAAVILLDLLVAISRIVHAVLLDAFLSAENRRTLMAGWLVERRRDEGSY